MKRFLRIIAFAGAAMALAACGGKKADNQAGAMEDRIPLVKTAVAEVREVPQTEIYSSTVEAYAINNIAPQTGGRIQAVRADVGSFVGRGQVLAVMDAAQLDQTRLKLVNDSTELSRLRSLYEEGGVSKSDYDAVEMAYNVSRRSFNNLVENTYLRSPISGVVTARNYDRGDLYNGHPAGRGNQRQTLQPAECGDHDPSASRRCQRTGRGHQDPRRVDRPHEGKTDQDPQRSNGTAAGKSRGGYGPR